MIPFLDPASTFFVEPDKHGYRVFHRTVEDHRRGMERASIINRMNYETRWLQRADLVDVGFRAVKGLMEAKGELGHLPTSWTKAFNDRVDDALQFIGVVHEVDGIVDSQARSQELEKLGDEILKRNNFVFSGDVSNQAFPVSRQIGGRWFDEIGWPDEVLDAAQRDAAVVSAAESGR